MDTLMDTINESREAVLNPTQDGFIAWFELEHMTKLSDTDPVFEEIKKEFWSDYLDALELTLP